MMAFVSISNARAVRNLVSRDITDEMSIIPLLEFDVFVDFE